MKPSAGHKSVVGFENTDQLMRNKIIISTQLIKKTSSSKVQKPSPFVEGWLHDLHHFLRFCFPRWKILKMSSNSPASFYVCRFPFPQRVSWPKWQVTVFRAISNWKAADTASTGVFFRFTWLCFPKNGGPSARNHGLFFLRVDIMSYWSYYFILYIS